MSNGRCRMHGGASVPPGPLHHSWKHGERSKFGKRINERLELYLEDEDIAKQHRSLAILDEYLDSLVNNLAGCPTCSGLNDLRKQIQAAEESGDHDLAGILIKELLANIEEADSFPEDSRELLRVIETRNRVSINHHRVTYDKTYTFSIVEFFQVLERVKNVILEEIHDREIKMRISKRLQGELVSKEIKIKNEIKTKHLTQE